MSNLIQSLNLPQPLSLLQSLSDRGVIRQIDYQFARFIASLEKSNAQQIGFVAGLVSHELSKGHVCLDIDDLDVVRLLGLYGETAKKWQSEIDIINWKALLLSASTVNDSGELPLVFDGDRLYLQRYWYYQQQLAKMLYQFSQPISLSQSEVISLTETLHQLFPESDTLNWQKVAAAVALTRRLAVISGGPGTGKTTTVTKLLSAIAEQGIANNHIPVIKLVAPTGKAAARLTESIGSALGKLALKADIKAIIPTAASTIHRLLGAMPNRAEFRHNQSNLLHVDVLVVDEASMVDLPLMYKLLDALPKSARLILLGDKDQLASVEAGAVLGDLCSYSELGYSQQQYDLLADLTGYKSLPCSSESHAISDSLCMLRQSYRFDEFSGIGQLAKLINSGDINGVESIWRQEYSDIKWYTLSEQSYQKTINLIVTEYQQYLMKLEPSGESNEARARSALAVFGKCRLLCANRKGAYGVAGLNINIEQALAEKRYLPMHRDLWYAGRPIMITRNDHGLGLYNGDIGICMLIESEGEHRLKVFFELADGTIKEVLPARVPEHETAFAMTIHKSQGSEFEHTYIMLPDTYSPILTRELIYTGITRAKQKLILCSTMPVFKKTVKIKTERLSGVKDALQRLQQQ